jgi:hypothetical protein
MLTEVVTRAIEKVEAAPLDRAAIRSVPPSDPGGR